MIPLDQMRPGSSFFVPTLTEPKEFKIDLQRRRIQYGIPDEVRWRVVRCVRDGYLGYYVIWPVKGPPGRSAAGSA